MSNDPQRGTIVALFASSCALLGLFAIALVVPGSPELAARAHPTIESMLSSGATAPGGARTLLAGLAVGVMVIVQIGVCVFLGTTPGAKGLRRWIAGGTVVYVALFCALMWSYVGYTAGGPFGTFLGLPTPSAWMVYGVWLFPWIFIGAYVVTFRTSYFPTESEERFEEILRSKGER